MRRFAAAVLAVFVWALLAVPATAQQLRWPPASAADSLAVRIGLTSISRPFPFQLRHLPPHDPFLRQPFTSWVNEWHTATSKMLEEQRTAALVRRWIGAPTISTLETDDVLRGRRTTAADTTATPSGILPGRLAEYADIGMRVNGRGELGGAWTRYQPCDPGVQFSCRSNLFPQLKPDMRFAIQVGGTISERVHVNVDYDQTREFDAANNLNVFYQGLPDEVLQRIEVGDVQFRLPASRYLTQGIPAGNFGLKSAGQIGPLEFQAVFAQQRGDVTEREFRVGGLGAAQGLVQDAALVVDDAEYARGQFFFLVDPNRLRGAPHIDALALRPGDAAADIRPAANGAIQIYRDERLQQNNAQQQGQPGYFLADAVAGAVQVSGLFKRLIPEEHYAVHPSGLWIMLRARLRDDEQLAISYVTEGGDTIGTFNAEGVPPNATQKPRLRLLRGAISTHQPGSPTWDYEMHQVYRLDSSSDVDPGSIDLKISLGELSGGRTSRDVMGAPVSLLRLFGLDEDAPVDQLDLAQIYQPGRDAFGGSSQSTRSGLSGTYVIFPTLRPFKHPAPVPSANLDQTAVTQALGADANAPIYDHADPVVRDGAGRFRLNFNYRLKVEGQVSTFSLGALGIREGSERLYIGERQLQQGLDYTIDYDIGTVTLNDAQGLFAATPDAQMRVKWEQKSLFQIAPTSVFGLSGRYGLGRRGELNFVGLYQSEKTIMSRPQLGVEPGAIMMGGISGRLDLGGYALDRALARIPGLRVSAPSAVSFTGELALSVPNPNTRDHAYLDDFEATDELQLPAHRRRWLLGSRPESNEHATSVLPFSLDASTAARLVWQHDIFDVANGEIIGPQYPRSIDQHIRVAGQQLPEPVLWLTFSDSARTGGKKWRSMTNILSTTGRDMSRSEYIEFYVRSSGAPGQALVLDIGQLSEDAFYVDAAGRTNGFYASDPSRRWGLGEFDQEANLANREIWGPDKDALGLWDQPCVANLEQRYVFGDSSANCARRNGEVDSEDLDGSGSLDRNDLAYFRFVIPLDDPAHPYLVRDTSETGTSYRLYRVPLRTGGKPVNGASDATWRFVKHLRMTVASSPSPVDQFALARMRIVGSRWTKRDVHGIVRGLIGDTASLSGTGDMLEVGPVSLLNDPNYAPPVGIGDELQDPSARLGAEGIEFNEKALRLRFNRLNNNERAEVYFRYAQQSRSFLTYRQLRMWAYARAGNWGPNGDLRLLIKTGNDPRNYYMFQTRLKQPATGPVAPGDWLPEIVIDFDEWLRLRADAEAVLTSNPPLPGQQLTLWSADSSYAIVLEDKARAPNFAGMRELNFAVYNGGNAVTDGEVWINDLRLSAPFKDPGVAGTMSMDVRAGDFLATNITYANQSAVFRQLNQEARYQQAGDFSVSSTAQLGLMTPSGWGIELPLTVVHTRSAQDPTFLEGTDVRADRLNGLRDVGANATRVAFALRKRTPSANPWVGLLIDGLSLRGGYNTSGSSSVTTRNEASGVDGGIAYVRELRPRSFDAVPGPIESVLKAITPARVEGSSFFKRLAGSKLRWTPERITFGSAYYQQERRSFQFLSVLELPGDSTRSIESPRHGLDNDAQISFLPFTPLRMSLSLRSVRDLLDTERASNQPRERGAIDRVRNQLGGVDIGWETMRSMGTEVSYRPEIALWLRPVFNYTARFGTDRAPSYLEILPDSSGLMQRRFQADRQMTRGLQLDAANLLRTLYALPAQGGDSLISQRGALSRWTWRLGSRLRPIDLNWNSSLGSQFERELIMPGFGYQVGLGNYGSYRLIGGDTAAFVNSRTAFSTRSGVRLPFNADLNASYEETMLDAIDQRGGHREQVDRRWPNLQLNWSRIPMPQFLRPVIVTTSFATGFERSRQRSLLGGAASQQRGGREIRIPVNLTFAFAGGFSATYTGNRTRGESTDPTGDAEQATTDHAIIFGGAFQPPESMKEKLQSPVTFSLSLRQTAQEHCRLQSLGIITEPASAECVPFIDYRNRTLNLRFDTRLSDIEVGFQMSYSSRKSFVGTHNGNSQFQLGLFGNFEMKAGRDLQQGGIR
ncbi:MAG: hypothetical protein WEE89_03235 [Gemmatimonadota bacterium]